MKMLTAVSAVFFLLVSSALVAAEGTLVFSLNENSAFSNKDKEGFGFFPEVVTAALKTQGVTAEYKFMPMARAVKTAEMGEVDGIIDIGFKDEFKDKFEAPKEAVIIADMVVVSKKDKNLVYSGKIEDLKSAKVGVENGTVIHDFLKKNGIEAETVTSSDLNLKKLQAGRIDYVAGPKDTILQEAKELNMDGELTFHDKTLFQNKKFALFSLKKADFAKSKELFDKGFEAIKKDGSYQKIMAKFGH